jgi:diguanylate cyclase (GGDEF)-like protein
MTEFKAFFNQTAVDTGMTDQQFERLVEVLSAAERNHREWLKRLNRSLVCGCEHLDDIVADDAHFLCRFGQWYYNEASDLVRGDQDFIALGSLHEAMHNEARDLALASMRGAEVSCDSYDRFADNQSVFFDTLQRLRDTMRDSLMSFDGLTGARNRQSFMHVLEAESARVRRKGEACCLALIDLDFFKKINDEHGHLVGDMVLRDVAQVIREHLRTYDSICRFGGEEFLVCLPATDLEEARTIMERLRAVVAEQDFRPQGAEAKVNVSVSIGLAVMNAQGDIEGAFRSADQALYRAKSEGRNRVFVMPHDSAGKPP